MNNTRMTAEKLARDYRKQLTEDESTKPFSFTLLREDGLAFVLLVNLIEEAMRKFAWVGRRAGEGPAI